MEATRRGKPQRAKWKEDMEFKQTELEAQVSPAHRTSGRRAYLEPPMERKTGVLTQLHGKEEEKLNSQAHQMDMKAAEHLRPPEAQKEALAKAKAQEEKIVKQFLGLHEEQNKLFQKAIRLSAGATEKAADDIKQVGLQIQKVQMTLLQQAIRLDVSGAKKTFGNRTWTAQAAGNNVPELKKAEDDAVVKIKALEAEKEALCQKTQAAKMAISELQLQLYRAQSDAEQQAAQIKAFEAEKEAVQHTMEELKEKLSAEKKLSAQAAAKSEAAILSLQAQLLEQDIREKQAVCKAEELSETLRKEREKAQKAQQEESAAENSIAAALKESEQLLDKQLLQWQEEKTELLRAKDESQKVLEEKEREWAETERSIMEKIADLHRDVFEFSVKEKSKKRSWLRKLIGAPARKEEKKEKKEKKMEAKGSKFLQFFK